ncbi:MAG: alpha-galactosidase [Sphingorhabdus sp.]|uniref:alpha-galactosidase n=1 Tax=Sphingorhabdus sp. TaxID=1902408 RepID=UPI00273DAFA3|nr:alpha-galactosidase [Sphingorhabdus sp.]MDP4872903.1 alpha-galactosidase [Sphingorhabdus sp.]MDP4928014.1 alpha-galactosidase [Sphingorhabdus sp.]
MRFDAADATLILACAKGAPVSILYWGGALHADTDCAELEGLFARQGMHGVADVALPLSLAMEPGLGHPMFRGFAAHRAGKDWGSLFEVGAVELREGGAKIICRDESTRLGLEYEIDFDARTGVLRIRSTLTNYGATPLNVSDMMTACLPVPDGMTDIIGFTGRWTQEFTQERVARNAATYLRENRSGRTSHFSYPAILLAATDTNESTGEVYGFHLAFSGNHRVRVDSLTDGRVLVSLGALLLPGEVRLAPGETYASPEIVAAYSGQGLSKLSRKFHDHVRTKLLSPEMRAKPRPVHYNTWEAVYFDHDVEKLKELATRAAEIGVERFVLDDGWFGGRRHDRAGLGDWTVSRDVYPDGLGPLVDHVTGLGMEFGLWFEPEMVNPDSDLYRAHPDWVLGLEGVEQIPFRSQLALDISRPEVADYLFHAIDAILRDHDISYIKWDMNRDLSHPGDSSGVPRAFAQVGALYALLDRVRHAHPYVEIESCSSGGARADMGVLAHSDRVWTSDSNDALDRQVIQRGASFFLPLEVLGCHVGPAKCHVTGRRLSMEMRAATALMGHMGLELNLLTERTADLDVLKNAIDLHKKHRALLHNGDVFRLDSAPQLIASGVIARDKSEAIYSVAYVASDAKVLPGRFQFTGLDPQRSYRLQLIWPSDWQAIKGPSAIETLDLNGEGAIFSGAALVHGGLQLPHAFPETCLLFYVAAV